MKAVALTNPGEIKLIDTLEPELVDEFGVILKPIIVSPCTSDVHTIFHGGGKKRDNLIMGHESVCKILKVGNKVKDFVEGEIVAVPAITPSWDSLSIQENNFLHADTPFSGHKLGRTLDGVFAEKVYVPNADLNLAKIPTNVSLEEALMTVDMVSTGFTAIEEANINFGDNVVIIGIGAVGLMSIVGAKLSGASRIVAVGSKKISVDLAIEYGATDIINYKNGDIVEQIRNLNISGGIDKVIICGGNDETFSKAFDIVKYGTGVVSNVNFFTGTGSLPIPKFSGGKGMAGKTLKMSLSNGGRLWVERLLNMISTKRFTPRDLITHKLYGIDKIIDGIMMMKDNDGSTIKIAIYLDKESV